MDTTMDTAHRAGAVALALLLAISTGCTAPEPASEITAADSVRTRVHEAIVGLDAMRSGLAGTIGGDESVDAETFARVCKPVGQRAAALGAENGWTVRQLAVKYRNPANEADAEAARYIARLETEPARDTLWVRASMDDASGWRYLHRIDVEPACLACHGAAGERPAFIVEGYPDDRAHGFEAGDLRGVYSVFVPGP